MPTANCSWTAPANGGSPILDYKLRRNGTLRATIPAGTLTYADTTANYGDMYDVAARNEVGTGQYSSPQVQFAAAPPPSGTSPVAYGIWIDKAELDALPTSGSAWTVLLDSADSAVSGWGSLNYVADNSSPHNVKTFGAALAWARLADHTATQGQADGYRTKARGELEKIVNQGVLSGSTTGVARGLGAYALAADLINLPVLDPTLDTAFRSYLRAAMDATYSSGNNNLYAQATLQVEGNTAQLAKFSVAAGELYLRNFAALPAIVEAVHRGMEITPFEAVWTNDAAEISWQGSPYADRHAQWLGVRPAGEVRDGHQFSGVLPNDYRRNGEYTAADFPLASTTQYPQVALEGMVGYGQILPRAGYPDVRTWGSNAVFRTAERIKFLGENYSSIGWTVFAGGRQHIVPMINKWYGTNWTYDASQSAVLNSFSFTTWTHQ